MTTKSCNYKYLQVRYGSASASSAHFCEAGVRFRTPFSAASEHPGEVRYSQQVLKRWYLANGALAPLSGPRSAFYHGRRRTQRVGGYAAGTTFRLLCGRDEAGHPTRQFFHLFFLLLHPSAPPFLPTVKISKKKSPLHRRRGSLSRPLSDLGGNCSCTASTSAGVTGWLCRCC